MKIEIGYKIKQIRKKQNGGKGLSMEEFGKLFDPPASKGVVSNWENNYNYPNEKRINEIAKLGNISVQNLLYGPYSEIMEKIPNEPNSDNYIDGELFESEKERLIEEHFKNLPDEITDRVKMSRAFLINYLESHTNTSSYNHSILLLDEALRYSHIHKTENNDDPVLVRFLEDIIKILNEYSSNDKKLDQYTEVEIRNNIKGKINYILDNAKKEE